MTIYFDKNTSRIQSSVKCMISSTTGKSGNRPDYHSQGDESKGPRQI